jgi:hypothetical protein
MCRLSIYYALSTLLTGGGQAILQAAWPSALETDSTPVLRHTLCSSSLVRCQWSFRCMPILRRLWISGRKEIALATSISCSKYYIRYVPGPACRGLAPLYVPPFSYKRGGTQRYNSSSLEAGKAHSDTLRGSQVHTSSQAQYITQWSRVLRSGGPNHSKPLCVLVFVHRLVDRQNA